MLQMNCKQTIEDLQTALLELQKQLISKETETSSANQRLETKAADCGKLLSEIDNLKKQAVTLSSLSEKQQQELKQASEESAASNNMVKGLERQLKELAKESDEREQVAVIQTETACLTELSSTFAQMLVQRMRCVLLHCGMQAAARGLQHWRLCSILNKQLGTLTAQHEHSQAAAKELADLEQSRSDVLLCLKLALQQLCSSFRSQHQTSQRRLLTIWQHNMHLDALLVSALMQLELQNSNRKRWIGADSQLRRISARGQLQDAFMTMRHNWTKDVQAKLTAVASHSKVTLNHNLLAICVLWLAESSDSRLS